jgi:membrane protease YdiL (CAAX protease family)
MNNLRDKLAQSPMLARVAPFVVFLVLTYCQGEFGEASRYWFYLAKTLAGAWMVWVVWPVVEEMRLSFNWAAVGIGAGVFALWVGLDGLYPASGELSRMVLSPLLKPIGLEEWLPKAAESYPPWNPHVQFGSGACMAWAFIVVRIAGSSLVVPPLEEVFYRSFLYRYIAKADFLSVDLGMFMLKPFLLTSLIFGFVHREWLAGILCGMAYQGLVCWRKRLGDAIVAHAITNLLLGLYVAWRGAWQFW